MIIVLLLVILPILAIAQTPKILSPPNIEAHARRPVFSPDGKYIAFEMSATESNKMTYVVAVSGGRPIPLALEIGSRFGGGVHWVCHEASWDPHGKTRLILSCGERGVGNYDLYLAEIYGEKAILTRLTSDEANEGYPAWGILNGRDILLFTSGKTGNGDIYRLELGGSGSSLIRLTNTPVTDDFAVLSKDGKRFLFIQRTSKTGGEGIYLGFVDVPHDIKRIVDFPASDETNPSFSPDGQKVAFFSNKGYRSKELDIYDLYVTSADGGNPVRVVQGVRKGDGLGPSWHPDGTHIFTVKASKKDYDPIIAVGLSDGDTTLIKTDTLMNNDISCARTEMGRIILAFTAQGRKDSKIARWRNLYVLELQR